MAWRLGRGDVRECVLAGNVLMKVADTCFAPHCKISTKDWHRCINVERGAQVI
jgi:hypothetical protein